MRWLAALVALVLAFFCKGFVQRTIVPTLANFLTHHYYPRVNSALFYVAWAGLALIFFFVLELLIYPFSRDRDRSKGQHA